jgi:hypothetical protein
MDQVLGIDIGGVIIDRVNDETDTSFFGENYLKTTAVPGAFITIAELVRTRFGKNVFLVSKCGAKIEDRSREWLKYHRFFEITGIPQTHLYFCKKRHEKAGICRKLNVTHFIDDRLEVLSYLDTVSHRFLFQPNDAEVSKFAHALHHVQRVESWNELLVRI